mgnify:FL=1
MTLFVAAKSGVILAPLNTPLTARELSAVAQDAGLSACCMIAITPTSKCLRGRWSLAIHERDDGSAEGVIVPHRMAAWNAYNTVG